jgi:predicted ATPase with chaperone activity
MCQMNLSAGGYHRVLKLARTIADLAGCNQIQAAHLVALTVSSKKERGCNASQRHCTVQAEDDDGVNGK